LAHRLVDLVNPDTLDLLRELSHRLRTPLATIHGYASLVEAHAQDARNDPADVAVWARRIQLETDRLNGLLTDLSRLRALAGGATRPTSLDLQAVVDGAIKQAETELDLPLRAENSASLPYRGDPTLLNRLAYHLAVLGIQRRQTATLRVSSAPDGARLELDRGAAWTPPANDVWLNFCTAVTEAHAGRLDHTPTGLIAYLGTLP
jgi:signal transduction histidine kinase